MEEVVTARWTSSDQGQPTELVAHGWLPTNKIQYDKSLRFWISFENRSESNVVNLHFVDFQAPGFAAVGKCWKNQAPTCVGGTAPRPLPAVLKPRETITVWATLEPAAKSGRYSPSAVFAWSSPGSGEFRKGIALGPIEITTWWREAILRSARRLHTLVRDLALPLLVVLVGLFFNRRDKAREDQRRDEEVRKAAAAKKADEFHAQILQTWSQLLQQFLQDTRRFYLPINSRLSTLRRVTRQHQKGNPKPVREHFFYLLSMMRQVRHLVECIGGFLFKDRGGEEVASLAWEAFLLKVDARFDSARRWQALDAIKVSESLTQFEARLAENSKDPSRLLLLELEEVFRQWLADPVDPFHSYLPLLDLFYQVSAFEINRPFEYWYGKPEPFPGQALRTIEQSLPADGLAELRRVLESYLDKEEGRKRPETIP